jgi:hypothetical protein
MKLLKTMHNVEKHTDLLHRNIKKNSGNQEQGGGGNS